MMWCQSMEVVYLQEYPSERVIWPGVGAEIAWLVQSCIHVRDMISRLGFGIV